MPQEYSGRSELHNLWHDMLREDNSSKILIEYNISWMILGNVQSFILESVSSSMSVFFLPNFFSLDWLFSDTWQSSAEMEFFSDYGDANRYKIQEVVGKGSYGVVCSAIDTHTGEKVAIKKIRVIF